MLRFSRRSRDPSVALRQAPPGVRRLRRVRRLARKVGAGALAGIVAFALLWVLFPFDLERARNYPASVRVLDRDGRVLRVYLSERGEFRFPVSLEEISPWVRKATIAVEDRRFASHPGVDPLAVGRALLQNVSRGSVHSGASTITMQLVRMLEPRPRNIVSKAIEAFHALQVERAMDKDEILELYLNLAPYGGNLRGVEAASMRYFSKSARELSLPEAALLAGLPQSPSRYRPDRHYARALARSRDVLRAMRREGMVTANELDRALAVRPAVRSHQWPFRAPHLSDLARGEVEASGASQAGFDVRTTLDASVQRTLETHIRGYFEERFDDRRELSGAAVAIDVETGAVLGLVGSPSFFDVRRLGQVNAATAPRSTGSALKPFLYALAFESGIASPSTVLPDVPTRFSAYVPENYTRSYLGPVSAARALKASLNVPAVQLQRDVGTARFLSLAQDLDLRTLKRGEGTYGLSLVLGGGEVRLLDLAAAYAVFPRLGVHRPYRLVRTPTGRGVDREERVLAAGAARLVLEALSEEEHVARVTGRAPGAGEVRVGYKTGTSFGMRDAWAIAFSADVVVGVWIGDPRGRPRPDLTGLEVAAPLAVSALQEIDRRGAPAWPGEDLLRETSVCAVSGHPPGLWCSTLRSARFAADCRRPVRCPLHRRVLVDAERGVELCAACRRGCPERYRVVECWPPEVVAWRQARRVEPDRWPHAADCPRAAERQPPPRILSPADGSEYLVVPDAPFSQELRLRAAASAGERLHWFLDGELVATRGPADHVLWPLVPGAHEIRCVDERGRATSVRIEVRRPR